MYENRKAGAEKARMGERCKMTFMEHLRDKIESIKDTEFDESVWTRVPGGQESLSFFFSFSFFFFSFKTPVCPQGREAR